MNLRPSLIVGLLLARIAVAQDATNLWLRYDLRVPVGANWTWHNEPDLRIEVAPEAGAFRQYLFRSEMQRRLSPVHMLAIGMAGVDVENKGATSIREWRPHISWYARPASVHGLMFRSRIEWREQYFRDVDGLDQGQISTLRCRAMVQYELPLKHDDDGMKSGVRTGAELLLRGYSSRGQQTFDQLRLSASYVVHLSRAFELEAAWLWFFRENDVMQQYFRLGLVHRLKQKPTGSG